MAKSPDAFRTISEVAEWLDTPAHVLRFWESRFPQIKPVKRAGGRRYYRPGDMLLIGGIKKLLHEDGMTIKGARKILREKGVKYVASLSRPLDTPLRDLPEISDVTIEAHPVPDPAPEAASTHEAMDAPANTPGSPPAPDTRETPPEVTQEAGQAPAETEPAEARLSLPEPEAREAAGIAPGDALAEFSTRPETPPQAGPAIPASETGATPPPETSAPGEPDRAAEPAVRPAAPGEAAAPGKRARGDAAEDAARPSAPATSPLPEPDFTTLLALLRNRPADAPPPDRARIIAIRERLVALHARMGDPGHGRPPG